MSYSSKLDKESTFSGREGRRSGSVRSAEVEAVDPNVAYVNQLIANEGPGNSPVDINLSRTTPLILPELEWFYQPLLPKKMKLTNTGHTVILSAKWHQVRPYLKGGPFIGNYVFSQLHFHWGRNNMEGSEHTIDGVKLPMEMHVVHFKSCYLTQEAALKQPDGIAVLVYFFKLQGFANPMITFLSDYLENIVKPHSSVKLQPLPLEFFLKPFKDDYFLYWGSVQTASCLHSILWLFCRESVGISMEQIDQFRNLLDINEEPLLKNFRSITELGANRPVFHISPSTSLFSTLHQFPAESEKISVSYNCQVITTNPFKTKLVAIKSQENTSNEEDQENILVMRFTVGSKLLKKKKSTVERQYSKCFDT